jgi:long-chain acyl-CoA synthetase
MNIEQILENTARKMPHKEAIVAGSQRITYWELDKASNRVANALVKLGMIKGDHVALFLSHSPEWAINYFGVIKGGGVAVLFSSALKGPELESFLRDSDSEILITERRFSELLSSILPRIPLLRHVIVVDSNSYAAMMADSPSESPSVSIKGENEATIFYTCGVLGMQKGVVHTHASLMGTPPIFSAAIQRKREDVIVDLIPFSYLFGLFEVLFGSIMCGSTVVIVHDVSPRAILEAMEREKGSIVFGVPAIYNALAMMRDEVLKGYNLNGLRMFVTGGAKSCPTLMKSLQDKFGVPIHDAYGLTETSGVSMGSLGNRKIGTVGKPICAMKILDDNGKEVRRGEIGEGVFRVPWVMKGYYKAPELTAQVIKDGWFYTGDYVRMDEEGYLEYIEKKSFVIVTPSALKVSPLEVESVLLSHPSVAEAAYVGIDNVCGGQTRVAFVMLKEGQKATAEELCSLCHEKLADFKLPKRIEFIENMPKTSSGEVDRKRLKQRELADDYLREKTLALAGVVSR